MLHRHGFGSGGAEFLPAYTDLLSTLASYGLVVLAPLSCPTEFCLTSGADNFFHDLLSVVTTCAANRSLHEGLLRANFSAVGVLGHSMGGTAAGIAAAHPGAVPLAAYVSLHAPSLTPTLIKIPTMHTTGGEDKIVFPAVVKEVRKNTRTR